MPPLCLRNVHLALNPPSPAHMHSDMRQPVAKYNFTMQSHACMHSDMRQLVQGAVVIMALTYPEANH